VHSLYLHFKIRLCEPNWAFFMSNVCKNQAEDALIDSNLCAQQEKKVT